MNNYRLSTFKQGATKLKDNIDKSLWDKVLNMEDIYIRDSRGLRIIAANRSLVKGQLFYLLAEGPHEEQNLFFQDSKACAEYFGVTSQTINDRLAKELPILDPSTRIEFRLSRRPVISRDETFKKGKVVQFIEFFKMYSFAVKHTYVGESLKERKNNTLMGDF